VKPSSSPLIIAHRGGARVGPENSLLAIKRSLEISVDGIEVDVRMSQDGTLVLQHDATIKGKRVEELTLEEIREIQPHITTLEECLHLVKTVGAWRHGATPLLFIEIKEGSKKYPGIEEKVIQLFKGFSCLERTIFLSFWKEVLEKIHSSLPNGRYMKLFYSVKRGIPLYKDHKVSIGYPFRGIPHYLEGVGIHWKSIHPWVIRECEKRDLKVYVWTVNDRKVGEEMKGFRVEGLITDDPRLFL